MRKMDGVLPVLENGKPYKTIYTKEIRDPLNSMTSIVIPEKLSTSVSPIPICLIKPKKYLKPPVFPQNTIFGNINSREI
jgi:hypothetical protein